MKKWFLAMAISMLCAAGASAQCLTITPGGWGPQWWYQYSVARSCWSTSSVSLAVEPCTTEQAWQVGQVSSPPATMSASFAVTNVYNPAHWNVWARMYLVDPDASWWNYIDVGVAVRHPDNTTTYYTSMLHWNGTMPPNSGCNYMTSNYFSADVGDTITVTITSANTGGRAYIIPGVPLVLSNN